MLTKLDYVHTVGDYLNSIMLVFAFTFSHQRLASSMKRVCLRLARYDVRMLCRRCHVSVLGETNTTSLAGSCDAHADLTTAATLEQRAPPLVLLDGGDPSRIGRADDGLL